MRSPGLALIATIAVATATACVNDITGGINGSGGDFSISVGSGTTPQYSWSSGPAFSIDVVRTSAQTIVVWRVTSPSQPKISSPVRHGTVPAGALESSTSDPPERILTPGVQYRVSIKLVDGQTAFQDFKP
jgi:hypothetical protein